MFSRVSDVLVNNGTISAALQVILRAQSVAKGTVLETSLQEPQHFVYLAQLLFHSNSHIEESSM
jgi:hypothetical protein